MTRRASVSLRRYRGLYSDADDSWHPGRGVQCLASKIPVDGGRVGSQGALEQLRRRLSGYNAARSSGYIRMQPWVMPMPTATGVLVAWIS